MQINDKKASVRSRVQSEYSQGLREANCWRVSGIAAFCELMLQPMPAKLVLPCSEVSFLECLNGRAEKCWQLEWRMVECQR